MAHDYDKRCPICGELTDSLAGNPAKWPVRFPKNDGTGIVHSWHIGCIQAIVFGLKPPYIPNSGV